MSKTILLADDSVTIRKVVELTFGDTDIRVEAVGSGHEALQRLRVLRPDLVLADVGLEQPSGYEICEAVKRSAHPVPVLLLAGTFEPFDSERARSCGADGHLVKPFESQTLIDQVETLLSRPLADVARVPASAPPGPERELDAALEELTLDSAADDVAAGPVEQDEPHVPAGPLSAEELEAVTRAVVQRLGDAVIREIAWEVVPELAERLIRERLKEIEREAGE